MYFYLSLMRLIDNWFCDEEKFLELFRGEISLSEYLNEHHDKVKEAYSTIKDI